MTDYLIKPNPEHPALSTEMDGLNHLGEPIQAAVVTEKPLTVYLNSQEVVTLMTIGDLIDELAVGFLINQDMLKADDEIIGVDYDTEIETVVVRTRQETNYEEKLKKKVKTSGCAQGTIFGDIMEKIENVRLHDEMKFQTSNLYTLLKRIATTSSLYQKTGGIHGCVLCEQDVPLIYMEDVGRHNAIDKIAGYMYLNGVTAKNKVFYTTGRLTSEMVIKTVQMGIPVLLSRSGFTAWGVELARNANVTLIGRAKGKRFYVLSGEHRLVYDADPEKSSSGR